MTGLPHPALPFNSTAIIRPEHPVGGRWGDEGIVEADDCRSSLLRLAKLQPPSAQPTEAAMPSPLPSAAVYGPFGESLGLSTASRVSPRLTVPAKVPVTVPTCEATQGQEPAIPKHKTSRRGGWPGGVPPPVTQARPSRKRSIAPPAPPGSAPEHTDATCVIAPRAETPAAPTATACAPQPAAWHGLGRGGGHQLAHEVTTLILG